MTEQRRHGHEFAGYVPNGTIVTQELLNELMSGSGARQPYDIDLKASRQTTEYQRLNFGKLD